MIPPRALVFDLDGTLIDSRADIAAACNVALVAHGRQPLPLERILPMVGDGARALVARAFERPEEGADIDAALATFRVAYTARPCAHTVLLPGAREVLELDLPTALVTNKLRDITELVLAELGIAGAFGAIWGGDDGPLKPSPAGVLAVLAKLDVAPSAAWVVGDGPQDIAAGRAAGCFTVGVPGIAERGRLIGARPDLVVESLHDVRQLAERLVRERAEHP